MTAYQPAASNHLASRFGDVAVRLSVELGRTQMPLRDVLTLGEGSTVALDRLTDELLDVTANGRVIARGEVVADKGRFALRIVALVGEDGNDVPPLPAMAPSPSGLSQPASDRSDGDALSGRHDAPSLSPQSSPAPPPVDPLIAALDDLL